MDNPVVMMSVDAYSNEDWYYYYADALGNVRLLTDASGAPVESYTYDVYGKPRVMTAAGADGNCLTEDYMALTMSSSMVGNPYLFTGRRWDDYTGLYYYRFRDYAPELGRFCQTDPLGYIDTMNMYAYCGNNPVNWIDPWGLAKNPISGRHGRVKRYESGQVFNRGVIWTVEYIGQIISPWAWHDYYTDDGKLPLIPPPLNFDDILYPDCSDKCGTSDSQSDDNYGNDNSVPSDEDLILMLKGYSQEEIDGMHPEDKELILQLSDST